MVSFQHSPVLIIGSGPAGYTAAIYAARAMLAPVLISGLATGGQLSITTDVENYPGFANAIQGPWLMEQMAAQAQNVGAVLVTDTIVSVALESRPFRLVGDSGTHYSCDALIIATGAEARWLGLPSEQKYMGHGVSACATCDGFFYRDKKVVVIGGGNTAVEEALFLTRFAQKVTLVHRRDSLRAEKILQKRLFAHSKITCIWNHTLAEVVGTDDPMGVTSAVLCNVESGACHSIDTDGIFIAIGHSPASALFVDVLAMQDGYIPTAADSTATTHAGVFAAGDVTDPIYRQAVTAAGQGCMAALEAERYLATLD